MEQERAVYLASRSIQIQLPKLKVKQITIIENHLNQVFTAGWEARIAQPSKHRKVCQFFNGQLLRPYESIMQASRITGIDRSNIGKSCRSTNPHKIKTYGFTWEYMD